MSNIIDKKNEGALALRDVSHKYRNLPYELTTPLILAQKAPFFGFIDIEISHCPAFAMFSNNDDFVAKQYFWGGADAYEGMSLMLWLAFAKRSAVIFDVGAYTGVYSLTAAIQNKKCKVHSFEPLDNAYSRLIINKRLNNLGNINIHKLALSDKDMFSDFNTFAGDEVLSTGSSLMDKVTDRAIFEKKNVRVECLDSIVSKLNILRLDLLKIDAEGAEHLIFKGGQNTIQKYSPDIICEFLPNAKTIEIEKFLSTIGYNYFEIDEYSMSINQVENIKSARSLNTLNTLITKKSMEEVQELIANL